MRLEQTTPTPRVSKQFLDFEFYLGHEVLVPDKLSLIFFISAIPGILLRPQDVHFFQ